MDELFVSLDAELVEDMVVLFQRLQQRHGLAPILGAEVAAEAKRLPDRIFAPSGSLVQVTDDEPNIAAR